MRPIRGRACARTSNRFRRLHNYVPQIPSSNNLSMSVVPEQSDASLVWAASIGITASPLELGLACAFSFSGVYKLGASHVQKIPPSSDRLLSNQLDSFSMSFPMRMIGFITSREKILFDELQFLVRIWQDVIEMCASVHECDSVEKMHTST